MIQNNRKNIIDYSSLILVLSFLVIHRLELVLCGMMLSIHSIYIKRIFNFIVSIKNTRVIEKDKLDKKDKNIIKKDHKVESRIELVELIEELGYIPSNNTKDIKEVV
tara:strand:- start:1634 stop:1954 length:321 start_codon:yes stop_codon:yes gene_type:complete